MTHLLEKMFCFQNRNINMAGSGLQYTVNLYHILFLMTKLNDTQLNGKIFEILKISKLEHIKKKVKTTLRMFI